MATLSVLVLLLSVLVARGHSWTQDEFDMFDLVEEVGDNFYKILQVEKDCSAAEIRRAYRKMSLQYHPDKNPDPSAAEIFRKINAVAEVLRDDEKRALYNEVLENGLPDWRQPVYYYRRVRKMSISELTILIIVILTIAEFLYGWAAYFEKQLVLSDLRAKRDEKLRKSKGKKSNQQLDAEVLYYEMLAESYIPRLKSLLPCRIIKACVIRPILALYQCFKIAQVAIKKSKINEEIKELKSVQQEVQKLQDKVAREIVKEEIKKDKIKAEKKLRKLEQNLKVAKLKNEQKEIEDKKAILVYQESMKETMESRLKEIEEDYNEEDMNGGGGRRMEGRKKMKKGRKIMDLSEQAMMTTNVNHIEEKEKVEESSPPLVNGEESMARRRKWSIEREVDDEIEGEGGWSQYQQNQLEWALAHYTKDVEHRWDKITKAVPGKSKVDCVNRYKELVQLINSKKGKKEETGGSSDNS